ncbi:MAG: hypothetical protein IAI48_12290 [Candidatus Eremiobacteraeota bacterium]|nr:hypothetical protein [Candidatus Eremiobacteraeota bacterium]
MAGTLAGCDSRDDLTILVDTLEDAHPDLFFHESRVSFDRAPALARSAMLRNPSSTGTFRAIAPLVSGIGDGHTYVSPYTSDYVRFRDHGGLLFPLELHVEDARASVTANYGPGAVPEASEVTSINGASIARLLANFRRIENGETPVQKDWNTTQDLRELLWIGGFRAPFVITRRSGSVSTRQTLSGCTIDAIHRSDESEVGLQRFADYRLTLDATSRIAVLTVHDFSFDGVDKWHRFLLTMLHRLRQHRIKSLVVDVRENTGGNTERSDELLETFAKHGFRDFSNVTTKISRVTKTALGHDRYAEIYGEDAWDAVDGTSISSVATNEVEPLAPERRFSGNVVIVTGSGTFSTAAIFAAAAQDSRNALIWGHPSGGFATLYGEVFSFELPHSKLSIGVSTKYLVRAAGGNAARGVIPDRTFRETTQRLHDTELDSIIASIARYSK